MYVSPNVNFVMVSICEQQEQGINQRGKPWGEPANTMEVRLAADLQAGCRATRPLKHSCLPGSREEQLGANQSLPTEA